MNQKPEKTDEMRQFEIDHNVTLEPYFNEATFEWSNHHWCARDTEGRIIQIQKTHGTFLYTDILSLFVWIAKRKQMINSKWN